MVNHNFIQDNEVHIKIGGDHGRQSYKESLQVCNTHNPNSKDNTVVFNIFEAEDYKPNLKTALNQYHEEIAQLQRSQWRYVHNILVYFIINMK